MPGLHGLLISLSQLYYDNYIIQMKMFSYFIKGALKRKGYTARRDVALVISGLIKETLPN